jgi:hypothetical protein
MFLGLLDPDPDLLVRGMDPYVFGLPGSGFGSISQRYVSGSGSFKQYLWVSHGKEHMIESEIAILSSVSHPNIIQLSLLL